MEVESLIQETIKRNEQSILSFCQKNHDAAAKGSFTSINQTEVPSVNANLPHDAEVQ